MSKQNKSDGEAAHGGYRAGFAVLVEEANGVVRGLDVFGGFFSEGHLVLMGEIRVPFQPEWVHPLGTTVLEGRTLPAPADTDTSPTSTGTCAPATKPFPPAST